MQFALAHDAECGRVGIIHGDGKTDLPLRTDTSERNRTSETLLRSHNNRQICPDWSANGLNRAPRNSSVSARTQSRTALTCLRAGFAACAASACTNHADRRAATGC